MDLHTWLTFVAATCVIAISPGSGAVLSMSHGLSFGVRKASATIVGLQLGLLLILLVAGAGVGSLLLASEVAFNAVKVLGACYLIYVGFAQWRSASAAAAAPSEVVAAPGAAVSAATGADAGSWQKRCATGFLTNATNPKGIIFMVAVLPQFISPERPLADAAGWDIEVIDVDQHPDLEARWGEWVPVLLHGEHELCHYHLDEAAVRAYLGGFPLESRV